MVKEIIHSKWCDYALILVMSVVVTTCGGWGDDGYECTATPAPSITSYPPTEATVGVQYRYYVKAQYACFPFVCNSIDGVRLPPGAVIDDYYDSITWTPSQDQANKDVLLIIATEPDSCGNRARQSWTVHVFPAPGIAFPYVKPAVSARGTTHVPSIAAILVAFSEPWLR